MPNETKKKKSKFARMSDEDRARYLQHRADIELEAKHRKQQLILIYTKNKLKREEAFARINTAKLNEQWRVILRKMKCIKLHDDIEYLRKNFNEILNIKDNFIQKLYNELLELNFDHKRFQEAHMMSMDNIIEMGQERISYLFNNYEEWTKVIKIQSIEDLRYKRIIFKEFLMYLKTIILTKNKYLEEKITEIKINNVINTETVLYDKNESILKLKKEVYPVMESLRQQLNEITLNYENTMNDKIKQYEYLKMQDDIHQSETLKFPKIYTEIKNNADNLNKNLIIFTQEREEITEDLQMQSDLLTKRVCKLRQEIKMAQVIDTIQLKKLSVASNLVIKDLQKIVNKSMEIQTIIKLCSDIELYLSNVNKFSIINLKDTRESTNIQGKTLKFCNEIDGFRKYLCSIKEENNVIKKEHINLIEENGRLKHSLRTYLATVSRTPTISLISKN